MVDNFDQGLAKLERKKEKYKNFLDNPGKRTVHYGFKLFVIMSIILYIVYLIYDDLYIYGIYIFLGFLLLVPAVTKKSLEERIEVLNHKLVNMRSVTYRYSEQRSSQNGFTCPNCGGNLISNSRCVACGYIIRR